MRQSKKTTVTESKYNRYKIVDLNRKAIDESTEEDSFSVMFSHCEIDMVLTNEDIISPSDNSTILVNKYQYYCKQCGLIKQDSTTTKKREQTGPRIPKRKVSQSGVVFKNISFTQTHPDGRPRSKLQEFLDAEDEREEEMLKAGGCIIGTSEQVVR